MALSGDDQLVEEYRKAARRLRRLAGRGGNFLDQVDFPAALQDLFPGQGTEAGGALEALVLGRKLIVVDRRDAGRSPGSLGWNRNRGSRRRLLLIGIADFLPLFPTVALTIDVDRIAGPENEYRHRWRGGGVKRRQQHCNANDALHLGYPGLKESRRTSYDARLEPAPIGPRSCIASRPRGLAACLRGSSCRSRRGSRS